MKIKACGLRWQKMQAACAKKDAPAMITDHLLSYRDAQNKEAA
jgi:hypothetical protein